MIDLRRLRDDAAYRSGAVKKGADAELLERLLVMDQARLDALQSVEDLRARSNAASKDIGRAAPEERPAKIAAAGLLKDELAAAEATLATHQEGVDVLVLDVPNPAHESVPTGGEEAFELIREVGDRIPAPPLDHADYGEKMGFVDGERAVRMSGSRFAYLMGPAVRLEFAVIQWVLDKLESKGFVPVVPPVMVREQMMIDAGFFPTDRNQVYELADDDLFLIGTAEVALAGLHRGERLDGDSLPVRYAGFSSCFRREAGTYGKDTRGIFRVHQFDKVEMFSYCDPENSWDELEMLRDIQEEIVGGLGLPYRVINVAAGDLGSSAAKKYDLEVWLPSEGAYREVTSCSNYTDYSARRLGTRFKGESGGGLVHTLNGTAAAIGRTIVFLMENNQQPDGSLLVPEVLRQWLGGRELIEAPDPGRRPHGPN
ncbi:MAG: serine--tRNA ligase [Actinomycetia bacterium]|nr:serine--tRNA ligase [Actinomycetes bacterium]